MHRPSFLHRLIATCLLPLHVLTSAPAIVLAEEQKFENLEDAWVKPWTPPAPVRTNPALRPNTAPPVERKQIGKAELGSGELEEIAGARIFQHPVKAVTRGSLDQSARAVLKEKLSAYAQRGGQFDYRNVELLDDQLAALGDSPLRPSLLLEKAQLLRRNGHFTAAEETYAALWEEVGARSDVESRRIAEMALKDYLRLLIGLGGREKLREILHVLSGRTLGGAAGEAYLQAREALWFFDNRAERNVFCGFSAANAVCVPLGQRPIFPDVHDEEEERVFIRDGLSLFELRAHSHEAGGNLRIVKRAEGDRAIPAPAVIHWKFGHYSAITERDGNRYRITDPHIGFDGWIERTVINEQASGYFLLPGDVDAGAGFSGISDEEAKSVFGRHCVHARDDEGDDCNEGGDSDDCGMATYSFRLLNPGLVIRDTPISHEPPYGPSINVRLTYDQRSAVIPDAASHSNFGPRWTHSLLSWVERIGSGGLNEPNTEVWVIRGNGAYYKYNYDSGTGTYSTKSASRPQLVFLPGGIGVRGYALVYPDGSEERFIQRDGPAEGRYFLSEATDPQGQSLTFTYDSNLRLTEIRDALNQPTTFSYTPAAGDGVPDDIHKIRAITDPFSRTATFTYDERGRLRKIRDPMGIESEFRYGASATLNGPKLGDFITELTTPYGTTKFQAGELPGHSNLPDRPPGRWIEAVDPFGDKERVEANDNVFPQYSGSGEMVNAETGNDPAPSSVTVAGQAVPFMPKNDNLHFRNTFYWDKEQMAHHAGDYTKATIYNWLTVTADKITSVLASRKEPLEGRVWFNYPGQQSQHGIGTIGTPSKIVRAVETPAGGTAWAMEQTLFDDPANPSPGGVAHPHGLPLGKIDAEGRELRFVYPTGDADPTNDLDLESIEVNDGGTWKTLVSFSNYINHLPQTVTDASGLVTQYDYNAQGQIEEVTLTKAGNTEVTKFTYDGTGNSGYLTTIEQTAPSGSGFVTVAQFTYDNAKRIHTATDADGYMLTYDYDDFDRVTLITHPDSTTEQFDYDRLDLHAVKDRGGLWNRTFHNALRQPVVFQDPKGRITALEWCRCGDIRKLIDPMGKTTWWKRDAQGRVHEKLLPDGTSKTLYDYQPRSGRMAAVTMPNDVASGSTVTYGYNLAGQMVDEDYADGGTPDVGYTYNDPLGRLTAHTDGLGATNYTYQPLTGSVPGAGAIHTINGARADDTLRYTYDWQNRLTLRELVSDSAAVQRSEQLAFDSLGRIDSIINGLGTFDYIYDVGNIGPRVDAIDGPGSLQTDYNYHPLSATGGKALRLSGIDNKWSTTTLSAFGYDYDASGRITEWSRNLGGTASTWAFEYSRASELTQGVLTDAAQSIQKSLKYLYDPSGNRLVAGEKSAPQLARYNDLNQLKELGGAGPVLVEGTVDEPATVKVNGEPATVKQVPGGDWRFEKEIEAAEGQNTVEIEATDATGNITPVGEKSWQFIVGPVESTLAYDDNGNLLSDGTRTFTWDAKNRLKSVLAGGVTYAWGYDGLDRRIRENRNGVLVKEWLWDGMQMIQERDASGAATKTFYGNGLTASGTNYFYTKDHLGNIREMLDTTGAVRARYDYDLYGKRQKLSGDLDADFGFTAHFWHEEIGLYLAPYRAYDPEFGRWISRDPLAEFPGFNIYSYVYNDPANLFDPDGQFAWIAAGAAIGAVAGGVSAALSGGDWRQGAVSGAVAGALASTGIGLVGGALTAGSIGVGTALGLSAGVGAAANVTGDLAGQVYGNISKGRGALDCIDTDSLARSGILGGAAGILGGGAQVGLNAARVAAQQGTANLAAHFRNVSGTIIGRMSPGNSSGNAALVTARDQVGRTMLRNAAAHGRMVGYGMTGVEAAEAGLSGVISNLPSGGASGCD